MSVVSIVTTGVLGIAFGARWLLPIVVLLGFFPVATVVSLIGRVFVPPHLVLADDG